MVCRASPVLAAAPVQHGEKIPISLPPVYCLKRWLVIQNRSKLHLEQALGMAQSVGPGLEVQVSLSEPALGLAPSPLEWKQ
jgi:hypothetical protein